VELRKRITTENIIKNVILIILLIIAIFPINNSLSKMSPGDVDSVLFFVNLILVAALFGNFSFSYQYTKMKEESSIMLGHATTFLLMLCIGLLFEVSVILISIKVPSFLAISAIISFAIYFASVLYDFWDLHRLLD
jgi:hypothetical protein